MQEGDRVLSRLILLSGTRLSDAMGEPPRRNLPSFFLLLEVALRRLVATLDFLSPCNIKGRATLPNYAES